jgi:hypothetical protein
LLPLRHPRLRRCGRCGLLSLPPLPLLSHHRRLPTSSPGGSRSWSNIRNTAPSKVPSTLPLPLTLPLCVAGKYPIKLLYTSNLPLVMYAVVAGNIFMISQVPLSLSLSLPPSLCSQEQVLYAAFPNSLLVHVTGKWELQHGPHGLVIPTAGIPYYLSPPQSLLGTPLSLSLSLTSSPLSAPPRASVRPLPRALLRRAPPLHVRHLRQDLGRGLWP